MNARETLMVGLSLGLFVGNQAGGSAFGAAKTAVTGVWSFVSETDTERKELVRDNGTWTGVWVFTGGYHALARMENTRTSLTKAELAARPVAEQVKFYEQLMHISSTAGTYSVDGSALRRQWLISQNPGIIGEESVGTFALANERLTVDLPRRSADSGPATRVIYWRLE